MTIPLGTRLRQYRKRNRLTLAQVATRTGLSLSYISDIEHGRSGGSLRALGQLCAAYGTTLGEVWSEVSGQDDVADVLATHPSPFRLIAEDYDEAIGLAGSMDTGVVEA